jgi:hypothetical protein
MTMFDSPVLEVAIGLVFTYAGVALMVSSITEAISSALKLRAKSLLIGVKQILNDQQFTGLARDVYNHALVSPRDDGKARDQGGLKNMPAYIPSEHFAVALVDSLQSIPGDAAELRNDIARISDPQLRHLLQGMYSRSEGEIGRLQQQLADWFDNGMDRLSGMYKRRTQIISFLVALAIAVLLNIDSVHLFSVLWIHPTLTAALSSPAATLDQLQALPVGWAGRQLDTPTQITTMVLGLIITASSALFGAPFWFDLLQHLVQLRGTGAKPSKNDTALLNHGNTLRDGEVQSAQPGT